ncbi:SLC13 family permease [Psychromonas sp. 14N.309.X.WAT.B.A12]|uniref:SLC13 family permease n=1 Tax=unclassified Psychromonas TaxID=2614957 RepID=UPI0025B2746D|nr:SLC13 family permease [Psychromonas sp. 14N.309.X.WAT.B.A12]MDN2662044.1 SLC13 family permease [Psychromonas sp. 14N.309.X.WAT.B.A12]
MTFQSYFVLAVFILTIIGLIKFQQRPSQVFGVALLTLFSTQMVTTDQVIQSLSNQGLLTLILLMLCSIALEKTRLLRLVAMKVIQPDYSATWLRLFGLTVLSSAFLNNTAVVSTMLGPIRNNPNHSASKLLIPLSYAAILGGTLTLVGTSTNLIVNSLVLDANLPSLGFFDFTLVGICVVAACGVTLYLCRSLLPDRNMKSDTAQAYFIEAKVKPESSLVGKSIDENGLRHLQSLFLVEIMRGDLQLTAINPNQVIQANDKLIFSGDISKVSQLHLFDGLSIFAESTGLPIGNLREVVVRPESILNGNSLKSVGFRSLFDAAVVAIKRDGEKVSGKIGKLKIKPGDFLVLAVGEDFKSRRNIRKNFILLSDVELDSRLSGKKELLAIAGFFVAIALAALGIIPLFKAVLLLLGVLLLSGCLTSSELLRRFPTDIWVIISSAIVLSYALQNSGVIDNFNELMSSSTHLFSPLIALIAVFAITLLLTELVTNNAAAALIFPIAYGLANSIDANPTAFIMAVAFGASASFISPYGYQTNLMVFNAGQYKLNDFIKIGVPVSLVYSVTCIFAIVAVFGL